MTTLAPCGLIGPHVHRAVEQYVVIKGDCQLVLICIDQSCIHLKKKRPEMQMNQKINFLLLLRIASVLCFTALYSLLLYVSVLHCRSTAQWDC